MSAHKLYGHTMFMDSESGCVLYGRMALMTDGDGRAEVQVQNSELDLVETVTFDSGPLWIPVFRLIRSICDIHEAADISTNQ